MPARLFIPRQHLLVGYLNRVCTACIGISLGRFLFAGGDKSQPSSPAPPPPAAAGSESAALLDRPAAGIYAPKSPLDIPVAVSQKRTLGAGHWALLLLLPLVYYFTSSVPSFAAYGPGWFTLATALFVLR